MSVFDIFKVGEFKKELEQVKAKNIQLRKAGQLLKAQKESIQKQLSTVERMEAIGLQKTVAKLRSQKLSIKSEVDSLSKHVIGLEEQVIELDETILLQSVGIYELRYDLEDSDAYKSRLDQIRAEQKQMVKNNTAATGAKDWTLNGSASEGRRMIKDYIKLILRSFNNECDATIIKAKYNNVDSLEKKIKKAVETLNKLGKRMNIEISKQYSSLKVQELHLAYEYALKKQEEKEEQRRIRAQIREEEKVLKEIERERKKLQKEIKHFSKAIVSVDKQIEDAKTDEERDSLIAEKDKIQSQMTKVNIDIENNDFRAKNTRAGHVYVISNLGSFGENIYKIGMTRRLEPQDRVKELGDASVPYRFDVHAMIFSEDAPALENALHKSFDHKRLNFVNRRREFFRVSLREIESVVKKNFNKPVEFTMLAKADEYRQSMQMRKALETTVKI